MAMSIVGGPVVMEGSRDEQGHRTYTVTHRVKSDDTQDGPANALRTPGLPLPGSFWSFDNDVDAWAWCTPKASAKEEAGQGERTFWLVDQEFTSKPPDRDSQRCQDQEIEDPLLEPAKLSGDGVRFTEEATHNYNGWPILTSSLEMVRGASVEFDASRPTIRIEMNVASYAVVSLMQSMVDHVNLLPIWGYPVRCVKMSPVQWERKFYGFCSVYYRVSLEFEVNLRTWDRLLVDEGTKALHGRWNSAGEWELLDIDGQPPNRFNPSHFDQYVGRDNNPTTVVLNGYGLPAGVIVSRGVNLQNVEAPGVGAQRSSLFMAISGTQGDPLHDASKWVPLITDDNGDFMALQWSGDGEVYHRGSVVSHLGEAYVSVSALPLTGPEDEPTPASFDWVNLASGTNDAGTYSAATAYTIGDYVREAAPDQAGDPGGAAAVQQRTGAGSIFVAKYAPANFYLLGVPISL